VQDKKTGISEVLDHFTRLGIEPDEINSFLESRGEAIIKERTKLSKLILRPHLGIDVLIEAIPKVRSVLGSYNKLVLEQAEIQTKYETYIRKEEEIAGKMASMDDHRIPESFDYAGISSLGTEAKQKLSAIKPKTIGQASRISGINPTDIQILMVFMGR